MGSGEGYTLDADEFKRRIAERRNKLIEAPIVSEVKTGGSDAQPQDLSEEYPMEEMEAMKTQESGTDNSGEPKSPLQ